MQALWLLLRNGLLGCKDSGKLLRSICLRKFKGNQKKIGRRNYDLPRVQLQLLR